MNYTTDPTELSHRIIKGVWDRTKDLDWIAEKYHQMPEVNRLEFITDVLAFVAIVIGGADKHGLPNPMFLPLEVAEEFLARKESAVNTTTALSDLQFRSLLDLFMCSDPWPVTDQGSGDGHETIESLLDTESKSRGYLDWVGAYHEFKPKGDTQ